MNRLAPLPLLALLGLCACQSNHELAVAKGPLFALNPGRWTPAAQDLQVAQTKAGELPVAPSIPPPEVGPREPTPAFPVAGPVALGR